MPLDPNIILGGQGPQIQNPLDAQVKALTMRHLAQQGQMQDQAMADDQANRAAARNNMVMGPDGVPTLNRTGYLSQLGQTAPTMAMQKGPELAQQDAAMKESQLKLQAAQRAGIKDLIFSATPETWTQMYQQYAKSGLPGIENITPQYPGKDVEMALKTHILTADEQLKQQNSDRDYQAKRDDHADRQETNRLTRERMGMERDTKDAAALDKHLALGWTARSGQAGVVQGKIVAAEAAEQLLEQAKSQPGGLDSRQIEELAQSTGKLLGGGASASARIEALVPHTAWGRVQSLKEYLANSPQGADQQAFTDRMAETVAREKALANNQKLQFQIEGLPAFANYKNRNPKGFSSQLAAKGIDSSMIDDKGRYKAPAPTPFHQMSDDELDKAYKAAGGK